MTGVTRICMLAGDEPHYVHSLVQGLAETGLHIELLGSSLYETYPYASQVELINVRRSHHAKQSRLSKLRSMLMYYLKSSYLIFRSQSKILHIYKFKFNLFEGIFLVFLYRLMGKKIVYTAHHIQPKGKHKFYKYVVFSVVYRNIHHIICHTQQMKKTLISRYRLSANKASVIHHGLNMSVPITDLSREAAREKLNLPPDAKILLIFGRMKPYKGVEIALESLKQVHASVGPVTLIVAGGRNHNRAYLAKIKHDVEREGLTSQVQFYTDAIADDNIELFFKSADILLLPYTEGDFQSGVLFLALRFGLPVIASNLGSFPVGIENGKNGFVFNAGDPHDLAAKIEQYYKELDGQPHLRETLRQDALETYNWSSIAEQARDVYRQLIGEAG